MIPTDIQVSRSKGNVKGQAYSSHVGEGGISVLQTSIFYIYVYVHIFGISWSSFQQICDSSEVIHNCFLCDQSF